MKIAIFYNLPYSGAKRAVQEHCKGLTKLGNYVDIYTLNHLKDDFEPSIYANKEYIYNFTSLNLKLHLIGRFVNDLEIFFKLKALHKKIASDIDRKKYNIVLVHTDINTQSPFILRYLKTKNVYYCLEPLRMVYEYALRIPDSLSLFNKIYETINRNIRKNIDLSNARSANHVMCMSYFAKAYLAQTYDVNARVSNLGVDPNVFKKINVNKKNQVLFVAPKEYIYGYDLIKQALEKIPKKIRPELKIVFGVKESKRISEEELIRTYNESIATVSLSRLDTFGLVPLESMACEVPVIATNVGAYGEIVRDGVTGFLVDLNPSEIAEKILLILRNQSLASKMGKSGRKWVIEKWTWEKVIKDLNSALLVFSKQ